MYGRTETSDMVYLHDHGKVTKRFTASVLHGTDKCVGNHAFSIKIHENVYACSCATIPESR